MNMRSEEGESIVTNLGEIAAQAPEWQNREGRTPVGMESWGKDHWSLLGYVETCTVDGSGRIEWERLTLSRRNWPMLWSARRDAHLIGSDTRDAADVYPLRLKRVNDQAVTHAGHCEGDALMDLVDAGLVTIEMPRVNSDGTHYLKPNGRPLAGEDAPRPGWTTGLTEWGLMPWARFALTASGRAIANQLRDHMATDGATWSNFTPEGA